MCKVTSVLWWRGASKVSLHSVASQRTIIQKLCLFRTSFKAKTDMTENIGVFYCETKEGSEQCVPK